MTRLFTALCIVASLTALVALTGCSREDEDDQTTIGATPDETQPQPSDAADGAPDQPSDAVNDEPDQPDAAVDDEPDQADPAVDDEPDQPDAAVDDPPDQPDPAVDDPPVGSEVPVELLNRLASLIREGNINPPPQSRQEAERRFEEMQLEVIRLGNEAIAEHPEAENLIIVRSLMLPAAAFLNYRQKTPESRGRLLDVADGILATDAPGQVKLPADAMRVRITLGDPGVDKAGALRGLADRYAETNVAAEALLNAAILADREQLIDLRDELADTLQADHADNGRAASFLLSLGREVPFSAVLTKLDGTTLTLPDDLLGKVVVVEFWTVGCPPCVRAMPHMKSLYENNKNEGLEVVGISLDDPDDFEIVQSFVTEGGYNWIHTFSGQWPDPTARNYGIRVTPTIWVIGRDGMVVSNDAMDPTARTLAQALVGVDMIVEDALAEPIPETNE